MGYAWNINESYNCHGFGHRQLGSNCDLMGGSWILWLIGMVLQQYPELLGSFWTIAI